MAETYFSFFQNVTINDEQIKDIFKQIDFASSQNPDAFIRVSLQEETPEDVSDYYYDERGYWWIIMIANNMKDYLYDWPMKTNEVRQYAEMEYDNYIEEHPTEDDQTGPLTLEEYYFQVYEENEAKKEILVSKSELLADFLYAVNASIRV